MLRSVGQLSKQRYLGLNSERVLIANDKHDQSKRGHIKTMISAGIFFLKGKSQMNLCLTSLPFYTNTNAGDLPK